MFDNLELLLNNASGREIYRLFELAIKKHSMEQHLSKGVLLGLSGGQDSVMLLMLLILLKKRSDLDFPIIAVHVNHGIRGDEALRDELFCEHICREFRIEYMVVNIDVPTIAKRLNIGIEEAARHERYSAFNIIISGREDVGTIVTAHNSSDNVETVLFNITRGAGLRGASGISPIRDNIIRPLLYVPKSLISKAFAECEIPYVFDSTNSSIDYTRNYLRHEVIPLLSRINPSYESSISEFADTVRTDSEYLDSIAESWLTSAGGVILSSEIRKLHLSLLSRVIIKLTQNSNISIGRVHVNSIIEHINEDNFRVSLPGEVEFVCERGVISIRNETTDADLFQPLTQGMNELNGFNADVFLNSLPDESSLKVYKSVIKADISSAIIVGELYVRFKKDGDSYRYGGMTHKLKKVFNDLGIPPSVRSTIPVICDDSGIVWVPGLPARDDGMKKDESKYIVFASFDGEGTSLNYAHKFDTFVRKEDS